MIEDAKAAAAIYAVRNFIRVTEKPFIVGIGSGSTVVHAVEFLGQQQKKEHLKLVCIPTSFQAKQLILKNGLLLGDIEQYPELDITIDGADEIDPNLTLIKGGGACLTMEKIIAFNSKQFIVIADESKSSNFLGERYKRGIPIEIIPSAHVTIARRLIKMNYKPKLRDAKMKAGPVITDNGCFILDLEFDPKIERDWEKENKKIKMIPGVVETGLFIDLATHVVLGNSDGSARVLP